MSWSFMKLFILFHEISWNFINIWQIFFKWKKSFMKFYEKFHHFTERFFPRIRLEGWGGFWVWGPVCIFKSAVCLRLLKHCISNVCCCWFLFLFLNFLLCIFYHCCHDWCLFPVMRVHLFLRLKHLKTSTLLFICFQQKLCFCMCFQLVSLFYNVFFYPSHVSHLKTGH
jgi:hypothetical protein